MTTLPKPMAFDGAVTVDLRTRELVVKPAQSVRAYAKYLWSQGHRTMLDDHHTRRIYGHPTVWAHGNGQQLGYGPPDDAGGLRFRFYPGDPNYKALVSTPGLHATIVVDRATSHILRGRGVRSR